MKKRSLEFTLGATVFAICTILFGLAGAATITVGSLTTQPGGQATVPAASAPPSEALMKTVCGGSASVSATPARSKLEAFDTVSS